MFKNILIPLDGSKHSKTALEYGIWLSKKFHANLTGLYVLDIVSLEGPFLHDLSGSMGFEPFLNFSTKMREILEEKGKAILKDFSDTCKKENVKHETFTETGIITNEICEKAKLADLIIMGRHGINVEFEYGLLGSTTEGVMRKSPQPVMVIPDEFKEISNPLFAYDGSKSASKTLHFAAEFSKTLKLPLTVINVSKNGSNGEILKSAEEYLKPYHINARFVLLHGEHKAEDIVKYYKDNKHNLIFMGLSEHSAIYEMVLGSTTEYVMRNIEGPVFVVR
ncbi:MAG: universal stress protein [Deltaproteobacteria bacterium]|nr:universal stress protein [Deltaproteobacteria bacterium]